MSDNREATLAYFISITRCERDNAIEYLERTKWRLDRSLNLFFENESKQKNSSPIHIKRIDAPYQQSLSKTIILPTMIEFQKFIELFDINQSNLLENSSKMMNLAMKYARSKHTNIPSNHIEHWKMHLKVDYTRLQTLLDNDMCAPLVWIEHFEHLLNGNISQLFDCDYMFNITDYKN